MPDTSKQEIKLFYCYAREDKALRDDLEKHLSSLKRLYALRNWHDREILPGQEWEHAIEDSLNTAHLILLLISPDFINSDYAYGKEMKRALERHEEGTCKVIPIILRPTFLDGAPFNDLQMLPTDAKPITRWPDRDEAFHDVIVGINMVIKEIIKQQEELEREIRRIERKIRIFGYETQGGTRSVLWKNPFVFSFDKSFNEWNNTKTKFQVADLLGKTWIKVNDRGEYWIVRFFEDQSLSREFLSYPGKRSNLSEHQKKEWKGKWKLIEDDSILRMNIDRYEIDVLATEGSPTCSGIEFEKDHKEPHVYYVFFASDEAKPKKNGGLKDASSLVNQICKQVLGYDAKSEDLIFFGSLLFRGERSVREVVKLIGLSPDYRKRYIEKRSIDEIIELCYQHFFARSADEVGKQHYIDKAKKTGFDAIIVELINSDEYTDYFGDDFVPARHWLETGVDSIKIELVSPEPKATVFRSSIPAKGRVEGLRGNENYSIVGYVKTDKVYEQEGAVIDRDNHDHWLIKEIKLGGKSHQLFFRIFDERKKLIAESEEITVLKD